MTAEPYLAILYAFANPASSGDNAVVAAVSGRKIRVITWTVNNQAGTANSVKFRSAANDKTSLKALAANATVAFAGSVWGPSFECNIGEALNINLSAATAIGCDVAYQLI